MVKQKNSVKKQKQFNGKVSWLYRKSDYMEKLVK